MTINWPVPLTTLSTARVDTPAPSIRIDMEIPFYVADTSVSGDSAITYVNLVAVGAITIVRRIWDDDLQEWSEDDTIPVASSYLDFDGVSVWDHMPPFGRLIQYEVTVQCSQQYNPNLFWDVFQGTVEVQPSVIPAEEDESWVWVQDPLWPATAIKVMLQRDTMAQVTRTAEVGTYPTLDGAKPFAVIGPRSTTTETWVLRLDGYGQARRVERAMQKTGLVGLRPTSLAIKHPTGTIVLAVADVTEDRSGLITKQQLLYTLSGTEVRPHRWPFSLPFLPWSKWIDLNPSKTWQDWKNAVPSTRWIDWLRQAGWETPI